MLDAKGAWFNFTPGIIKDAEDAISTTLEPKHQGFQQLLTYLESNPKLTEYLAKRIRTVESKS